MELQVSFRGKPVVVTGVGGETAVEGLKEKLEGLTGVPVANQKLVRGREKDCRGRERKGKAYLVLTSSAAGELLQRSVDMFENTIEQRQDKNQAGK